MDQFQVVTKLKYLYVFYNYDYQYMYPTKGGGSYTTPHSILTDADMYDHLDGKKTVCVRGGDRETIFHCYDIDEGNKECVRILIDRLVELGIPGDRIYVSMSGNKGYHVEYFFDRPVYKSLCENFFSYVRRDPKVDAINMECRPVRELTIKIPLGINFKTGRRCWYVDQETLEPIRDYEYVLNIQKISADAFCKIVYECNKRRKVEDISIALQNKTNDKPQSSVVTQRKSYVCKTEPVITGPGQRHECMKKKATWLRAMGADEEEIYKELIAWVERQDSSYISSSWREIEKDAFYLARDAVKNVAVKTKPRKINKAMQKKRFCENDIRTILPVRRKTARKVAMLIYAYCKVFGTCSMSFERMAGIIDCSAQTVQDSVNELISAGIIKKKPGGIYYENSVPKLRPNTYMIAENPPADNTINTLCEAEYRLSDVGENFSQFYYGVLKQMCDQKTLTKYLSRMEAKEI